MLLLALLLAQTAAAPAPCAKLDTALPPALAGWTRAPVELLKPGTWMDLPTGDPGGLNGMVKTDKPGKAAIAPFVIDKPGIYGIATDQGGWIDIFPMAGGDALKSVAHGHGPECSTIRKIVRFDFKPGIYRLTITGLTAPKVKAMLVESGE
jgi:hypothetical protein